MPGYQYEPVIQPGKDTTEYRCLTQDYVSTVQLGDKSFLQVDPEGLKLLAKTESENGRQTTSPKLTKSC